MNPLRQRLTCAASSAAVAAFVLSGCGGGVEEAAIETPPSADEWHTRTMEMLASELPPELVPEVEVERIINPDEAIEVRAACMEEEGFPGEVTGGGLLHTNIPADQQTAFFVAEYVCVARYPSDPRQLIGELSDTQWLLVYEHRTTLTLPCVRGLGLEVADPPSLATFLSSDLKWDPLSEAEQQIATDSRWEYFEEVEELCPTSPPRQVLLDAHD